jgi:hypothetical protein
MTKVGPCRLCPGAPLMRLGGPGRGPISGTMGHTCRELEEIL